MLVFFAKAGPICPICDICTDTWKLSFVSHIHFAAKEMDSEKRVLFADVAFADSEQKQLRLD